MIFDKSVFLIAVFLLKYDYIILHFKQVEVAVHFEVQFNPGITYAYKPLDLQWNPDSSNLQGKQKLV